VEFSVAALAVLARFWKMFCGRFIPGDHSRDLGNADEHRL
jgi:hypothetical protein